MFAFLWINGLRVASVWVIVWVASLWVKSWNTFLLFFAALKSVTDSEQHFCWCKSLKKHTHFYHKSRNYQQFLFHGQITPNYGLIYNLSYKVFYIVKTIINYERFI